MTYCGMNVHDEKEVSKILLISGIQFLLLFCGAFITPQGEIHESLLVGFS